MRKGSRKLTNSSGAGTILALMMIFVILGIFSVGGVFSLHLLGKSRLQATTDSIALAATDALRGISTGYPCIVAKDIATQNQLVLDRCRIVGFEVFVETSLEIAGILHKARARAGPGEQLKR